MAYRMTPNQVVAWNLFFARIFRGLTQEEAAERLEPYIGTRWSKATFSAAEKSVAGKRIRQFDADEIVAFSRAFDVPLYWFFVPPDRDPWRQLPEIKPPTNVADELLVSAEDLAARVFDVRKLHVRLDAAELAPDARERMRFLIEDFVSEVYPEIGQWQRQRHETWDRMDEALRKEEEE